MKGRILEKLAAVACALCLAVGVMSGVVFARDEKVPEELPVDPEATFVVVDLVEPEAADASDSDSGDEPSGEEPAAEAVTPEPATPAPAVEVTDNREEIPFYVGEELWGTLPILNGAPYAPVYDFCRALGLNAGCDLRNGVSIVTAGDITFQGREGDPYFVCNGRYLPEENGVVIRGGMFCLPVEELARCLGVTVSWDRVRWTLTSGTDVSPLESGDSFYDETDLYWLSRVIYAEAGDQSLRGQIAVGDVVLNRMVSDQFPGQDTVYDVIFAKNQFEVVINGMIYMEPDETAIAAAKLALEGYEVTGGCTYFAMYYFGEGYECVMWIDDHCFMVEA